MVASLECHNHRLIDFDSMADKLTCLTAGRMSTDTMSHIDDMRDRMSTVRTNWWLMNCDIVTPVALSLSGDRFRDGIL